MNLKSLPFKIVIGTIYLIILTCLLWWVFFTVGIENLMDYDFIRSQKSTLDIYKENHFFYLTIIFFLFSILWVCCLGFALPLLIFAGLVFGTWWGTIISVTATTIGATLLYILGRYFFSNIIEEKLFNKFSYLTNIFKKNELFYFMCFRFVGGGGAPYAIQNVLPVLFDMSLKNYIIATFIGSMPSMFVTVALGSGIEKVIDQNTELSVLTVLFSPDIYIPIAGFFVILMIAFLIKKFYLKQ